jgi:hypothetical protein
MQRHAGMKFHPMPIGAADVRPKPKWPIHEASEEQRVEKNPDGEDCEGDGHGVPPPCGPAGGSVIISAATLLSSSAIMFAQRPTHSLQILHPSLVISRKTWS